MKILVKDVKQFILRHKVQYALSDNKKLYITLRCGPNVARYIVEDGGKRYSFTKLGDAVRFFNSWQENGGR